MIGGSGSCINISESTAAALLIILHARLKSLFAYQDLEPSTLSLLAKDFDPLRDPVCSSLKLL